MPLKFFLLIGWLAFSGVLYSQSDSASQPVKRSCSCSFSSIIQAGTVVGERGYYGSMETINGIRFKNWFTGIGAGYDYYTVAGVPLFLDVRKYFFQKKVKPFVYADGGLQLGTKKDETIWGQRTKYADGFYGAAGIGLRLGWNQHGGLLMSAGYSYKVGKEKIYSQWCDFGDCEDRFMRMYTKRLTRLSFKLGLQF